MRYYKLTYLITPDITEEEAKTIQESINALIQNEKGILTSGSSSLVKKTLGAPINKIKSAFIGNLNFGLDIEKIKEIQEKLVEKKEILRFMLLYQKPKKLEPEKPKRRPMLKEEKPTETKKVELKEIEKKLDEILDK